jgi:hypothetical protein
MTLNDSIKLGGPYSIECKLLEKETLNYSIKLGGPYSIECKLLERERERERDLEAFSEQGRKHVIPAITLRQSPAIYKEISQIIQLA